MHQRSSRSSANRWRAASTVKSERNDRLRDRTPPANFRARGARCGRAMLGAMTKHRGQRLAQGRIAEREAGHLRLVGQHALAADQELVGEIAGETAQQRRRDRDQCRAAQRARELPREDAVVDRHRRGRIHRAGEPRRRNDMGDQAHEIVALDPRHPLAAMADAAAEPEFERRQQPGEQAAVGAEHRADAQTHGAYAMTLGRHRGALPGLAEPVREAGLAAVELGQHLVLPQAIPADRGAAHQYGRLALEPRDQAHHVAGHAQARGKDAAAARDRPQAAVDRLAREIDDRVDRRVARDLVELRHQRVRWPQAGGLARVARQHDRAMAGGGERLDDARSDEPGRAGDEHGLARGQRRHQVVRLAGRQTPQPLSGGEIAPAEQRNAGRRDRCQHAPGAMGRRHERGRGPRPGYEVGHEQRQDGTVVERQQRMVDALARRQLAARVLLDEVHQRHDDFDDQHGEHRHCPEAVRLGPTERDEQQGIKEVARAVQPQFALLRGAPGEALGQLVVIERVERSHEDLHRDEKPEGERRHVPASRKTAVWRISAPKRE